MIVYDGTLITSVANVKIEDVRVNAIDYDAVTRPRAIRGGSDFVRNRAGTRTISVTFALLDDNMVSRKKSLMAVSQWAKTDKEYRLELPGHPENYLMAVCTEKPDPSTRQWWENKLRLVFTCYDDPYWQAKSEKSVACGTTFFVLGDAPPLMRIERTISGSAAANQSYTLDGKTIIFSSIPVGDMVIDLNRQTAAVGNDSIMQYYNINSRFLVPRTGSQSIIGTGTVKYRERFE